MPNIEFIGSLNNFLLLLHHEYLFTVPLEGNLLSMVINTELANTERNVPYAADKHLLLFPTGCHTNSEAKNSTTKSQCIINAQST